MKPVRPALIAAAPGALLVAASLLGWVPGLRDLSTYFAPLRERTAAVLAGQRSAAWAPESGCGEPYYANPQTGVVYPPAWFAVVLPPPRAVGVEIGLHFAILASGCALLALHLGARPWLAVAAGWGAVLSGPVIDAAGVMNNLDTLAWLPWLWWATLRQRWRLIPLLGAAAYLAAEPQLALLGWAVTLSLAPRKRTLAGLVLAGGLVAAQALPFAHWVAGGDRGPGTMTEVRGAVSVAEAVGVMTPGLGALARSDAFVPHLTLPLWVLALAGLALVRGDRHGRILAAWGWGCGLASVVVSLPGGRELWLAATLGMVRYPGRLLMLTAVLLAPVAAATLAGISARPRVGMAVGVAALVVGIAAGGATGAMTAQALAIGVVVGSPWATAGALLGSAALAAVHVGPLRIGRHAWPPAVLCLDAQAGEGRTFAIEPSAAQIAWLAERPDERSVALGYGMTTLGDKRRMVRSHAPLSPEPLARHLAEADRGPAGRWWLDTLAATRLVAHRPIAGFSVVCSDSGVFVMANPRAWPETSIVRTLPRAGERPIRAGTILQSRVDDAWGRWIVTVADGQGVFLRLATPGPGWRWSVDGQPSEPLRGPGIVHGVELAGGSHMVETRYSPPGLLAGLAITLVSAVLLGVAWRRW